jgi:hypothetical protein
VTDTLHDLVLTLDTERPWEAPPAWVRIYGAIDDRPRVEWDEHLERLVGYRSPPDCTAVGVVAGGTAFCLEPQKDYVWVPPLPADDSPPLMAPGERRRMRVTAMVSRDRQIAGRLHVGDGQTIDEPPGCGRMVDCLYRCLGLPTDPPAGSVDKWLALMWLGNVAAAADSQHRQLTWGKVARLHPAMQVLDPAGEYVGADDVVRVARIASRAWTWTRLLEDAGQPGWLATELPPGAASWMDEGIFSRWLLSDWPELADLVVETGQRLPDGVARRLRRTLRELELLKDPGPARAAQ